MTPRCITCANGTDQEPTTLDEALALNKRMKAKEIRKAGERVREAFLIRKFAENIREYLEAVMRPEPRIKKLLLTEEQMGGPPRNL